MSLDLLMCQHHGCAARDLRMSVSRVIFDIEEVMDIDLTVFASPLYVDELGEMHPR